MITITNTASGLNANEEDDMALYVQRLDASDTEHELWVNI